MQDLLILLAFTFLLGSCSPNKLNEPSGTSPKNFPTPVRSEIQVPRATNLHGTQKARIGMKIWKNESGGKESGLTHWNVGEEFPSLGIGHFIWYPHGFDGRWTETWPEFVKFAQARRSLNIPAVALLPDCPWRGREEFQREFNGPALSGLRRWLAATIELQTDFIMAKSRAALPKIMNAAPASRRAHIKDCYEKVATTVNGAYSLIDYVNFKGDGTNPREQYRGQGWGLMWVLKEMLPVPTGQAAAREFAAAAKRCLDRRVQNSPPDRGEQRWTAGWHNRCNTYVAPF
tara:strand:+ start:3804 stop:4667 length:864 start_codon:yes stop_codon:yes gene_type:complete